MKKLNQIITVTIILGTMLGVSSQAYAENTKEINGDGTESTVTVEATIGPFDNTTSGPNPEDINMWINVTVPITVLFYSTKADTSVVESPTYQVVNNSSRRVEVDVAPIINKTDIDSLTSLKINTIDLINDGEVSIIEDRNLFMLGDNSVADSSNIGKFSFAGTVESGLTKEENPGFDLMLKFKPLNAE